MQAWPCSRRGGSTDSFVVAGGRKLGDRPCVQNCSDRYYRGRPEPAADPFGREDQAMMTTLRVCGSAFHPCQADQRTVRYHQVAVLHYEYIFFHSGGQWSSLQRRSFCCGRMHRPMRFCCPLAQHCLCCCSLERRCRSCFGMYWLSAAGWTGLHLPACCAVPEFCC